MQLGTILEWGLALLLIVSSLGILLVRKPVHAALCFLATLVTLATFYLQLAAPFVAVLQLIVYAGAILVIFMFVIVLFQDAHERIDEVQQKARPLLLAMGGAGSLVLLISIGWHLLDIKPAISALPASYGTVASTGRLLYLDFFFPFEAVILIFLTAIIGALYIAKREKVEK